MDDVLGGLGSLSGSGHVKRALGQRVQAPRRANPASGHAGRRWATSSPHPLRTPWEACPVAGAPRARPGPRPGPSSGGHSSPSQPRPRSRPDLADRSVNRPRPRSRPLPFALPVSFMGKIGLEGLAALSVGLPTVCRCVQGQGLVQKMRPNVLFYFYILTLCPCEFCCFLSQCLGIRPGSWAWIVYPALTDG